MAFSPSSAQILLLFCTLLSSVYGSSSFILPVSKDASSFQYLTQIHKGNPLAPLKLVVDLGGPSLCVDSSSENASSSTSPVPGGSIQCLAAKGTALAFFSDSTPPKCGVGLKNPFTGATAVAELVEDLLRISSNKLNARLVFSSSPRFLLRGLATGAKGMLGLGRTLISLPSQLSMALASNRKFSICLSSSNGFIIPGGDGIVNSEISKSLMYTPLLTIHNEASSQDYFINVKAIRVNGKRVSLKGAKEAKLSTVVPYTTLQSSIYTMFAEAFMEVARSMNITRVKSVAPFQFCFGSESIEDAPFWVDLVLQSEMVKWRMSGRNSMVKVKDGVACLGFLNGGLNPEAPIVLGGYQLEETLMQFDLGTSMLGFRSSLRGERGCSNLNLLSLPI